MILPEGNCWRSTETLPIEIESALASGQVLMRHGAVPQSSAHSGDSAPTGGVRVSLQWKIEHDSTVTADQVNLFSLFALLPLMHVVVADPEMCNGGIGWEQAC